VVCLHRQGEGWFEAMQMFCGHAEGDQFLQFCVNVFYGQLFIKFSNSLLYARKKWLFEKTCFFHPIRLGAFGKLLKLL